MQKSYFVKCENKRNPKFWKASKSRKHFMLSKTFNVANVISRREKKMVRKIICF